MQSGDIVYLVKDWQKRAVRGREAILAIKVYVIHEDHAKIGGHFYLAGQDFYLDREVAVRRLRELVYRSVQSLETSYKKRRDLFQGVLADEEKRLARIEASP